MTSPPGKCFTLSESSITLCHFETYFSAILIQNFQAKSTRYLGHWGYNYHWDLKLPTNRPFPCLRSDYMKSQVERANFTHELNQSGISVTAEHGLVATISWLHCSLDRRQSGGNCPPCAAFGRFNVNNRLGV